mmetsp:Transcript_953/g.1634  ORF Transcript_953/g.1634 Transcript_953/m.1634 type:complete len:215 (-) Transcript_953:946-1590(-)
MLRLANLDLQRRILSRCLVRFEFWQLRLVHPLFRTVEATFMGSTTPPSFMPRGKNTFAALCLHHETFCFWGFQITHMTVLYRLSHSPARLRPLVPTLPVAHALGSFEPTFNIAEAFAHMLALRLVRVSESVPCLQTPFCSYLKFSPSEVFDGAYPIFSPSNEFVPLRYGLSPQCLAVHIQHSRKLSPTSHMCLCSKHGYLLLKLRTERKECGSR